MNRLAQVAAATLACLACLSAQAATITLSFTASGFGTGAPTDPVSGSFTYEADSIDSAINSLQAVSLNIDGHAYTLGEVSFTPLGGNIDLIYGSFFGLAILATANDFWLSFDRVTGTGIDISYATSNVQDIFITRNFTNFSRTVGTANPVPAPATWGLLALGLAAAALRRRRAVPVQMPA